MNSPISQITTEENVTLITLDNIPANTQDIARIFSAIGKSGVNIDMISQTSPYKGSVNISFSLQDEDLFTVLKTLKSFKADYEDLRIDINSNNVKISLFGEGMKTTPGTAAKTMKLLAQNDIEIQLITTSEVDISYLIAASDKDKAIKCFKEYFNI